MAIGNPDTVLVHDAVEARKARLLEQVAAEFDRDMAEAMRLAAKYPDLIFIVPGNHDALKRGADAPAASPKSSFDGRVASLIACYRADPKSGYPHLRFRTRENYDSVFNRFQHEIGETSIASLKSRAAMQALFDQWASGGHLAMANSKVAILKVLVSYGAALEDADCLALKGQLSHMRFTRATPRIEPLTAEHVAAICNKAHELGLPSIGLAQAIQFATGLKQKSVIGEWVPLSEPGTGVIDGNMKWLHGLRWSEIDDDLVLRHAASHSGKILEQRLSEFPIVMAELGRLGKRPTTGPVIVFEKTGKPYQTYTFRREWRRIADAAKVPKQVQNRNSQVGAYEHAAKDKESAL